MNTASSEAFVRMLEIGYKEFLPVFDGFSEGVLMVDRHATIIYYNPAMTLIDELQPSDVLGKKVVDVYDLSEGDSCIMQCLQRRRPIIDRPLLYRTRWGKIANTLHTVFPLFRKKRLEGAICLVREYRMLEETLSSASLPRSKMAAADETRFDFDAIVGCNVDFLRMVNTAKMAAGTPSPIMLYGETGTGKELFAQAIHNRSENRKGRYTAVNCAAIPENLLEGILFGTTRGAFTGACDKTGLFEQASGGTLFLDELNSMTQRLQAKILRVVQERKVRRLGSLQEKPVDLKIISSVNKEPHVAISENALRPDLFYRLGVVFIPLPPLRERKEDIVLLARHFLAKHSQALNRNVADISSDVLALFSRYDWPGNVRELEHVIEGAINLVVSSMTIERRHLQSHPTLWRRFSGRSGGNGTTETGRASVQFPSQERAPERFPSTAGAEARFPAGRATGLAQRKTDLEKEIIAGALTTSRGNISQAARQIGISRQLLAYKMRKYHLRRGDYGA